MIEKLTEEELEKRRKEKGRPGCITVVHRASEEEQREMQEKTINHIANWYKNCPTKDLEEREEQC